MDSDFDSVRLDPVDHVFIPLWVGIALSGGNTHERTGAGLTSRLLTRKPTRVSVCIHFSTNEISANLLYHVCPEGSPTAVMIVHDPRTCSLLPISSTALHYSPTTNVALPWG